MAPISKKILAGTLYVLASCRLLVTACVGPVVGYRRSGVEQETA